LLDGVCGVRKVSSLEDDLFEALRRLRDYRAWAIITQKNPWMVRQALVMCLEMDTIALREQGVNAESLEKADRNSRAEAHRFVAALRVEMV